MWLAISRVGRDATTGHVWYRDALSHLISSPSGEPQFQAAVLAGRRV